MGDDKRCPTCGDTKQANKFHKDKYQPSGLTVQCKECRNSVNRKNSTPEKSRAKWESWYSRNKEQYSQRRKDIYHSDPKVRQMNRDAAKNWAEKNRERRRAYRDTPEYKKLMEDAKKRFAERNPGIYSFYCARYRADRRQRIPGGELSELDDLVIREAHALAGQRSEETGAPWEVDHMIPLRCKKASGLHCAHNMQVIPRFLNRRKGRKMMITEPLEWLNYL